MHHGLHSASDRPKPFQPQQVQASGSQRGHHSGAIDPVAVGVLTELGVADPEMRTPRRMRASGIALRKLIRSRSVAAEAVSSTER